MVTRIGDAAANAWNLTLRYAFYLLGAGAVIWAIGVLPIFWKQYRVERIYPQILAGVTFNETVTDGLIQGLDFLEEASSCRPSASFGAAVLRLRHYELALAAGRRTLLDTNRAELRNSINVSLACSPAQPFLWFVLYWLEVSESGSSSKAYDFLRMSYALGANEAWVSAKRNGLVLPLLGELPDDLAKLAVAEFASLVRSQLYGQALSNFMAAAWDQKDRLLLSIADLDERRRYEFSHFVRSKKILLPVPGVAPAERRPWNDYSIVAD